MHKRSACILKHHVEQSIKSFHGTSNNGGLFRKCLTNSKNIPKKAHVEENRLKTPKICNVQPLYEGSSGLDTALRKQLITDTCKVTEKKRQGHNRIRPCSSTYPRAEICGVPEAEAVKERSAWDPSCTPDIKVRGRLPFLGVNTFLADELAVELEENPELKPCDWEDLNYVRYNTDHIIDVTWSSDLGWECPSIKPYKKGHIPPNSRVFQDGSGVRVSMRAYRDGKDGEMFIFRPELYFSLLNDSLEEAGLPLCEPTELLSCIKRLISIDKAWFPVTEIGEANFIANSCLDISMLVVPIDPQRNSHKKLRGAKLQVYLSPTGLSYPIDSARFLKPIKLLASDEFTYFRANFPRSFANIGNFLYNGYHRKMAERTKNDALLYLTPESDGVGNRVLDTGNMDLFVYWLNEKGEKEVLTPPMDGRIRGGVMRETCVDLLRLMNDYVVSEQYITMNDILKALNEKRLKEIFTVSTGSMMVPVDSLTYKSETFAIPSTTHACILAQKLHTCLAQIMYNKKASIWLEKIEIDANAPQVKDPGQRKDCLKASSSEGCPCDDDFERLKRLDSIKERCKDDSNLEEAIMVLQESFKVEKRERVCQPYKWNDGVLKSNKRSISNNNEVKPASEKEKK